MVVQALPIGWLNGVLKNNQKLMLIIVEYDSRGATAQNTGLHIIFEMRYVDFSKSDGFSLIVLASFRAAD